MISCISGSCHFLSIKKTLDPLVELTMSQRFLDKTDSESENSQDIFSFPLLYEEIDSTIYVIQELLRKKQTKKS